MSQLSRFLAVAFALLRIGSASLRPQVPDGFTWAVPDKPPNNASPLLDAQPIGVSIEFFAYPEYINDIPATTQCLSNLADIGGEWPPMRIGGTTQDRARYDPDATHSVEYTVRNPPDAPSDFTWGPNLFNPAGRYKGKVTIGLNRRLNDLNNTIKAAKEVKSSIKNLYAIELGNEPNLFEPPNKVNTAGGDWTQAKDIASEKQWQASVCDKLQATNIISAGNYFGSGPFDLPTLIEGEGTSLKYVKNFCNHFYPLGTSGPYDLAKLMNHKEIAAQIAPFKPGIDAAIKAGKDHTIGETNTAPQGGEGASPTFAAALWTMDYSLQLLHAGTKAIYFHQGTIGKSLFSWWGRDTVSSAYYGAYFASLALAGADRIAPLDDFTSEYGGWVFYQGDKRTKVLLYNSVYYAAGIRPSKKFTLTGLRGDTVSARRLTAGAATDQQDQGKPPSISGVAFADGTCEIRGDSKPEKIEVTAMGRATVEVLASEALLIEL